MTITLKIDEDLLVRSAKYDFDDADNYCGRAAKFAVLEHLAKDLVQDTKLRDEIIALCEASIEELAYVE